MRLRALAAGGCALAVLAVPATANAATAHSGSASQAKQLAKAGVLTPKDLKGWEFEPIEAATTDDQGEAALYKCLGLAKPSFTARNRGYDIGNDDRPRFIDSSADVASSTARARAYFSAMKSKKAVGCMQKFVTGQLGEPAALTVKVTVKAVPITVPGADKAVAFHIVEASKGLVLDGYLIQALVGRTEITVSPVQLGGGTPGLSQGRSLAQTLVKRVRAL